jgi:glycine/D-amino acid oxidase-like deaminating enzyme
MNIEVLIVGQGLAGSLLAWELIQRQRRVLVVDSGAENASQVAAGLINPVAGRRLLSQGDVGLYLQGAKACYQQLNAVFRQSFLVELPMLRILQSVHERDYALKRLLQTEYQPYLSGWSEEVPEFEMPYGGLRQTGTGYLRTGMLLNQLREFLINNSSFRCTGLVYDEIRLTPALQWQQLRPRHIVFCEGHLATRNPWFGSLPFQLAKGEILTCQSEFKLPQSILNYGKWLIPLVDGGFKTGASFDVRQLDELPTVAAETLLLTELAKVWRKSGEIRVVEHKAGIRPTTLDKQPLLGSHPRHVGLHIFNGFGSKGSLCIPKYAEQFADWLLLGRPLPDHVDVSRYYETHFPA